MAWPALQRPQGKGQMAWLLQDGPALYLCTSPQDDPASSQPWLLVQWQQGSVSFLHMPFSSGHLLSEHDAAVLCHFRVYHNKAKGKVLGLTWAAAMVTCLTPALWE